MTQAPLADNALRPRPARFLATAAACVGLLAAFVPAAEAQDHVHDHAEGPAEHLAFDRPESWVLAHFASATLLSGLEGPRAVRAGEVTIGFELAWLPPLDAAQRRVGFNGIKEEDLNKAPFLPRPRVSVGLPWKVTATVAATPPIRLFGVKAALVAVGLERPMIETPRWTVGLRGYGQLGWVRSDFTCPSSVVAFEPGSAGNEYGCQAPSSDTASLRYAGGEASLAYTPASSRVSPHLAIGVTRMDVGFEVDALTFGLSDHAHHVSRGTTVSGSGGISLRLTTRAALSIDVFYSPLSVRRTAGAPVTTDGFLNARALVTYRLR